MQTFHGMSYFPVKCSDPTKRTHCVHFSGTYPHFLDPSNRNPKLYHGAAKYLSLPTSKCAMVAAHIWDLRAAASCGYKTVYVRRETEDNAEFRNNVKSKKEGGEVDAVVDSLLELVSIVEGKK